MPTLPISDLQISYERIFEKIEDQLIDSPYEVVFTGADMTRLEKSLQAAENAGIMSHIPVANMSLHVNRDIFMSELNSEDTSVPTVEGITGWAILSMNELARQFRFIKASSRDYPEVELAPGRFLHGVVCEFILLGHIASSIDLLTGEGATDASRGVYAQRVSKAFEALSQLSAYQIEIGERIRRGQNLSRIEEDFLAGGYFDESLEKHLRGNVEKYSRFAQRVGLSAF